MKIEHRFASFYDENSSKFLERYGIVTEIGFGSVVLADGRADFEEIKQFLLENGGTYFIQTKFSAKEIKNATFLHMQTKRPYGYPKPDGNNEFHDQTYGGSVFNGCGIASSQPDPFRLSGTAKIKRDSIFQVNWVHDEFFVRKEIFNSVFKKFGIRSRMIIDHRANKPLEHWVQLKIPVPDIDFQFTDAAAFVCDNCGKRRRLPHVKGFLPGLSKPTELHMFKLNDWFGDGKKSFRIVCISNA